LTLDLFRKLLLANAELRLIYLSYFPAFA
jgi:hypothetical protein